MDAEEIGTLISRCALGDRAAFGALYDETAPKLMGVCLRVLRDRAVAEEAMQDCFIKIWRHAERFQTGGVHPMGWMATIARNTAIDRARAGRAHEPIDRHAFALAAPGPGPEAAAIARSEATRIADCLAALPPERAEAVRGAYLDGRSYAELAEAADVPLNTMKTWLRRALITLRSCVGRP